jgi:hypothetical protein
MKFFVTKLDRRMNGYGTFSHRLDFTGNYVDGRTNLQRVREWLWENYGPGAEYDVARMEGLKWGWDTDEYNRRIYVNPEQLSILQLKFSV